MKNFKVFISCVISLIMIFSISTIAFAADLGWDYDHEIKFYTTVTPANVAAGDEVSVAFYLKDNNISDALELTDGGTICIHFAIDTDKFTYSSVALGQSLTKTFSSKTVGGKLYYTNILEASATVSITDEPLFTYTFTVNDGVSAGTYDIITDTIEECVADGEGKEAGTYVTDLKQVTVKSAEATKYTVTFNTDGGSAVASQEVEEGKCATVPENPTKDGYTFKGWDKDIAETVITAPTTFTAQWEKNAPAPVTPSGSGSVGEVKIDETTTYSHVYTGEFSATPAAGTKFTKIGAIFYPLDWESKEETYKTEHPKMDLSKIVNFEGTGVLTFKAAIVGVPDGVTIVSEPYTVSENN